MVNRRFERSRQVPKSMVVLRPVFVLSTGRAGSMMLARTLREVPGLLALHEPRPHLVKEGYLRWKGALSSSRAEAALLKKRGDLIEQVSAHGLQFVESSHYCSHFIPELSRLFDAAFIFLHRDPRGFTRSGLARSWWYPPFSLDRLVKDCARWLPGIDIDDPFHGHRLDPPRRLDTRMERVAWLWAEINRIIIRDLEQIPLERKLEFKLADTGSSAFSRLLDFLGCGYDDRDIEKMLAIAEARPNQSNPGKPPPTDWDEQAFRRLTDEVAERLGYTSEAPPPTPEQVRQLR